MRRQFHWDKKYLYWGITAFLVLAAEILFYMALSYLPALGKGLSALMRILSPFVWGLVITYLLHPLMKALERSAFTPLGLIVVTRQGHSSSQSQESEFDAFFLTLRPIALSQ